MGPQAERPRFPGPLLRRTRSPCLSSCSRSDRPLVELSVEPAGFSGRCTGVSVPLRVVLISHSVFAALLPRVNSSCGDVLRVAYGIQSAGPDGRQCAAEAI